MKNRLYDGRIYITDVAAYTIDTWISFFERKKLDLNAEYQREYVWKEKQQQEFLNAIVKGMPLSAISAAKDEGVFQYEIVDGKQRLTTLQLFVTDQITIELEDEKVFFSQLSPAEQNSFLNFSLPMILLQKADRQTRIQYFININFGGVPQSEDHHQKVRNLLE